MEYAVEEFLDGKLIRTVDTNDVPLTDGKAYTAFVPDVIRVDNRVYELTMTEGSEAVTIPVNNDTLQSATEGDVKINSMVASGDNVVASLDCDERENLAAYCVFYNEQGKMLSVDIQPMVVGENSLTFTRRSNMAVTAKLIVLDNQLTPQCATETVEIA